MNSHSYFQAFRRIAVGFAATVAVAQAVDIGAPVLESRYGRATAPPPVPTAVEAVPTSPDDGVAALRGAQGPLRAEPTDQMERGRAGEETVRVDIQAKRYPMSNGVGIP